MSRKQLIDTLVRSARRRNWLTALQRDGFEASQVDIRLKGTGSGFFSGIHKTLPREEETADNPVAMQHLREWFGDDQNRPRLARCYKCRVTVIDAFFDLADAIITVRSLLRRSWTTHRWDERPDRRP